MASDLELLNNIKFAQEALAEAINVATDAGLDVICLVNAQSYEMKLAGRNSVEVRRRTQLMPPSATRTYR